MLDKLVFMVNRLRERLWVKPLLLALLSVAAVFLAKAVEGTWLAELVPTVSEESVSKLLEVMAASMLVIATFAVGSMVAAYSSASSTATPRSFTLIVADDVSQNALSAFIGAFIFSLVGLVALKNSYFDKGAMFVLFLITVGVFAVVLLMFVRWVDTIARLGRLGSTVDRVESAADAALERWRTRPCLGGVPLLQAAPGGVAAGVRIVAGSIGYLQHVAVSRLQDCACALEARIVVAVLPGKFVGPDEVLAVVYPDGRTDGDAARRGGDWIENGSDLDARARQRIADAFTIGAHRVFDDDPRFGLITLAEIAARALSPAVNDPGTAIGIIGVYVRLLAHWVAPLADDERQPPVGDRVHVPELSTEDMFEDAFAAIARDGAGSVEVGVRLQKAMLSLAALDGREMRDAAKRQSRIALQRAERQLTLDEDLARLRELAAAVADV